ncbi:hypothetical protein ANANG_G00114170 [Anguilla anguilla]|uniref:Uncharacterized protein n=1 Tax=Anguilla anguilla TaxID=7936 RepID=A0A9D3ME99_ANGAN|nr:hypothetical protein ANANG_G00114170 [Anguilla anguilla]
MSGAYADFPLDKCRSVVCSVSKVKRCRKTPPEQAKAITAVEERPEDSPPPPLVVDHERLQGLLELVVVKTALYTVDQLERLFSILSQCIYQHRRDYDKTRMTECKLGCFGAVMAAVCGSSSPSVPALKPCCSQAFRSDPR